MAEKIVIESEKQELRTTFDTTSVVIIVLMKQDNFTP